MSVWKIAGNLFLGRIRMDSTVRKYVELSLVLKNFDHPWGSTVENGKRDQLINTLVVSKVAMLVAH